MNTKNSGSGTCFREVAEKWLDTVAARKNRSWKQQKRQLERHVYPAWKNRDITDLRRRDVYLLLDGLDGKVLPNRILALLKTVMNFAVLREWVEKSPADGIPMPRHERPRQRVLTMGELSVVQEACVQLGYPFGSFVQMLMLTAQRRTEVASMRWAEIDFDSMNWVLPAMKTKSYTAHSVPLSSFSAALLKGISVNGEFVFSNDGRTHISGFSSGKRQLDARANSVRGQVEGWRLHDLRRSAATHMVRLGARETIVSRILNHSQNGLTTRVYALHSHAADKRCALQNWGKELKRNLGNIAGHDLAS
ncbi:MAG: tyrosine-type recombinase/integrase [Cyanobacteria bacterium J06638_22]